MIMFIRMIFTAVLLTLGAVCQGGMVEVVGSFASPVPHPRFGLDFDTRTRTLWGIDNAKSNPNIMNFDLSGNLIQGFVGVSGFNSIGIAVDPRGQNIFYWQNLGRYLRQAHYPDGTYLGTTQFPFGYQNAVSYIDFDPVQNRVVLAKVGVSSPEQGIDIKPGFDFVIPGSGIDYSVDLDILGVGGLAAIRGFELSENDYWILGLDSTFTYDQIVQIDRKTGRLVDRYILPEPTLRNYDGLTLDPSTGLFYANYFAGTNAHPEQIRVLKLTSNPVPEPLSLVLASQFMGIICIWRWRMHERSK